MHIYLQLLSATHSRRHVCVGGSTVTCVLCEVASRVHVVFAMAQSRTENGSLRMDDLTPASVKAGRSPSAIALDVGV